MAAVRATSGHTFNVDDRLGHGATCNVFKGLSKTGEFHALKIFEPYAVRDINREVTALQKLKHENIIRFFGVEAELISKQVVVVMEFCEGGSLQSFLQEPANIFGLCETELLLLLKHLVSGMEHIRTQGFVHRDIKPGNILRCISKDGSSVFKLSDFGTARPLEDDEFFKSLVGTEEYLHPDLFNAAFMNEGKSLNFPHSVDLWSLGATIYNAATGTVPFCPYHRRSDKNTMFEMISRKPVGVIGARQDTAGGEIQWMYELPDTCQLSGGLQRLLVPMLVALFEKDSRRVWTFDRFFQEISNIVQLEPITFLTLFPHPSPFDKVYLPQLQSIADLKQALAEQCGGSSKNLHIVLYGESRLNDWLEDDEQVYDMPLTDVDAPLIPLPGVVADADGSSSIPESSMAKIVSEELSFPGTAVGDIRTAREMCGTVALIHSRTTVLATFQQHLYRLTHKLRSELRRDVRESEKTFQTMMEMFDVIKGTANMGSWSQQEKDNFREVTEKLGIVEESLQTARNAVKLPFEDNQWNFDGKKCMQQTKRATEEAESWLREIVQMNKTVDKARFITHHTEKCQEACKLHLVTVYKGAVSLWSDQCFQKASFLRESFLEWYRSYLAACNELMQSQQHLSTVVSLVTQLFKSCVNRSQGHKKETQRIDKSLLQTANTSLVERSQLDDLMIGLQDLTSSLEVPEVFHVPVS